MECDELSSRVIGCVMEGDCGVIPLERIWSLCSTQPTVPDRDAGIDALNGSGCQTDCFRCNKFECKIRLRKRIANSESRGVP
jgi:hypothetical protein